MLRSILLFCACAMLLAPASVAQQLGPSEPDLSQPIAEVGPGLGLYLVRKEYVVGAFGCTYIHYIFSDGTELVQLSDCGDAIGLLVNALIGQVRQGTPLRSAAAGGTAAPLLGSQGVTLAPLANGNTLVAYTSQTTLTTAIASSTGTVQNTGQYTVGPTASHVIAADFNGDGNLDLAVSNFGNTDTNAGGNVAIFLGKGDGTFTAGPTANAGQTPVSMYAADFNGDGKIDLAVADLTVGTISVLLGKGDGTFQSPVAYMLGGTSGCPAATSCLPNSLVAVDVNGDGRLDLAVLSRNSTLSILLGKGDGTFQAPITYPTGGTTTTYLASMDLNGDGKPDLIAAAQLDTISFLFGNGDGSFQAPVEYVAGDMPEYFGLFPTSSGVEIATVDDVSYDLVLMPVLPNGQAAAPQVHPLTGSVSGVAAADLNGDVFPDMVAANGPLTVLIRKPGAEFAAPVSYSLKSGSQAVAVALADLRGNGHNDAIASSASNSATGTGGTVDVALGNGDGTLGAQTSYAIGGPPGSAAFGTSGVVTGDFNGDGKPDVAAGFQTPASGSGGGGVSVLLGIGDGTLRPAVNYPVGNFSVVGMATGDFNGDGKLDIAAAVGGAFFNYFSPGALQILLGNGDGTFKNAAPIQVGSPAGTPVSLAAADVNRDGKLDLVAVVESTNLTPSVMVLLGNGDGTFRQLPAITTIQYQDTALAIADVNGDGIPDVIAAAAESAYLLGNGDGTFQAPVYFSSGPNPTAFAVTDWNHGSVAGLAGLAIATQRAVMAIQSGLLPTASGLKISSVENAEGGAPAIAPNTWVEIDGSALAPAGDSRIWQGSDFVNNQLPTQLDGVSVTVNGKAAYVYYISPTQVNILTPPDALPSGTVPVVVTNKGSVSATFNAQAQPLSPSFFVYSGTPYVAAEHANGTLIGPASLYPGSSTPAKPGETVELFANGFGPTSQAIASGSESQGGTLSPLPNVTIGGVTATVTYAGLISPGLFQINVTVPSSLGNGDQPLMATYGGQGTQSGVVITVQQ